MRNTPNTLPRICTSSTMIGSMESFSGWRRIVAVFFIKSLNRSRIIHKCNDHFTVGCHITLLTNHDIIAAQRYLHSSYFHPLTFSMKQSVFGIYSAGIGKYPSICSCARIGCPAATVPTIGTLTTSRRDRLKLIIHDLDSSWFRRVSADIPVLLQCLQMRMDRRCGLQVNRFTDIPALQADNPYSISQI